MCVCGGGGGGVEILRIDSTLRYRVGGLNY